MSAFSSDGDARTPGGRDAPTGHRAAPGISGARLPAAAALVSSTATSEEFFLLHLDRETRWAEIAIVLAVTVAAMAIPDWFVLAEPWRRNTWGLHGLRWDAYWTMWLLLLGAVLTVPAPARNGLHLGTFRQHWRAVLLVTLGPPLLVACIYPLFPVRPFGRLSVAMWTTGPVAQNLIFPGFVYGRLALVLPGKVHRYLPVRWALVWTCLCFGLFHLPNMRTLPLGVVLGQLAYTSVLMIIPGLSRQWTGSILYATLCHALINLIAWNSR